MALFFISEMVSGVTPQNGFEPVKSQQKSSPRQQMSTALLQPSFLIISGAKYSQLPHNSFIFSPGSILDVNPKSHIFTSPFSFSNIFSGFRSLQISPFSCRLIIPKAICIQIKYFQVKVMRLLSSAFLLLLMALQRSPCTQNSQTKYAYLWSSILQNNLTLYLEGYSKISYQFLIISRLPLSLHSALLMRFMQNSCLSYFLSMRKISAQVPSPIFRSTLKWLVVMSSVWQSILNSESGVTISKLMGSLTIRLIFAGSYDGTWSSSKQSSQFLAKRMSIQKFLGLEVMMLQSNASGGILPFLTRCFRISFRLTMTSCVALTI